MNPPDSPAPPIALRRLAIHVSEIGLQAAMAIDILKDHPDSTMAFELRQVQKVVIRLQAHIDTRKPTRRFRKDPPAGKES